VSTIAALFYSTQQSEVIKESFGIPSLTDIGINFGIFIR